MQAKDDLANTGIVITVVENNFFQAIADLIIKYGLKECGFESKSLSFEEHRQIAKRLKGNFRLVPAFNFVEDLRKVKSSQEIALIKKAAKIASLTMGYAFKIIRPGEKERKVALELEQFMKYKGADACSFDIIVAGGSASAYPHAFTSDRKIMPREMVLIDLGATFAGYNSDLTRMVFSDRITQKQRRSYEVILEAQRLAIHALRPGKKISDIDGIARNFISRHGLGQFFCHGLGHGVGLEIHELPFVNRRNNDRLQKGMVVTIEPACYIPGWGGIRIEDTVLITSSGCEILTDDNGKRI